MERDEEIKRLAKENEHLRALLSAIWVWLDALPSKPSPDTPLGMLRAHAVALGVIKEA